MIDESSPGAGGCPVPAARRCPAHSIELGDFRGGSAAAEPAAGTSGRRARRAHPAPTRTLAANTEALAVAVVGWTVLLVAAFASGTLGHRPTAVASAAGVTLAAFGVLQLADPLATANRDLGRTLAVWGRLSHVLSYPADDAAADGSGPAGSIIVRDLSFDRGRGVVVSGLSFWAAPGQTAPLNGPSEAGMTHRAARRPGPRGSRPGAGHRQGREPHATGACLSRDDGRQPPARRPRRGRRPIAAGTRPRRSRRGAGRIGARAAHRAARSSPVPGGSLPAPLDARHDRPSGIRES